MFLERSITGNVFFSEIKQPNPQARKKWYNNNSWKKKKTEKKIKYLETENATGVKIILTETNEEIKHFSVVHKTFFPN